MTLKEKMQTVKVENLIPYEQNPKKHPPEQVDKIASSIKKFGFKIPLLITEDYEIVAGHGRLEACRKLGREEVPAIVIDDLNKAEIKAFRLADNRVAESRWDDDKLGMELEELDELDIDLEDTGFDEVEIDGLIEEPDVDNLFEDLDEETDEDEEEDPDTVICPQCGTEIEV